jgi:hypothetical protein
MPKKEDSIVQAWSSPASSFSVHRSPPIVGTSSGHVNNWSSQQMRSDWTGNMPRSRITHAKKTAGRGVQSSRATTSAHRPSVRHVAIALPCQPRPATAGGRPKPLLPSPILPSHVARWMRSRRGSPLLRSESDDGRAPPPWCLVGSLLSPAGPSAQARTHGVGAW